MSSLSIAYESLKTPKQTVAFKKRRDGKDYNAVQFLKTAIAFRDMPVVRYLVEKEKVDIQSLTMTKTNFLGFKGKQVPISEYARKEWPELNGYLSTMSGDSKFASKICEEDEEVDFSKSSAGFKKKRAPRVVAASSTSQTDEVSSRSKFDHNREKKNIRSMAAKMLEKSPKEEYFFQHYVDMSIFSMVDYARSSELAPKCCWLLTCYLNILNELPEATVQVKKVEELFRNLGALPPFNLVPFPDADLVYLRHPFVELVTAKLDSGSAARERSKVIANYMTLIAQLNDIYLAAFPPSADEEIEPSPPLVASTSIPDAIAVPNIVDSPSAGTSGTRSILRRADDESVEQSTEESEISKDELPPENAGIARGFLGTLGTPHKQKFQGLNASKSTN